MKGRILYFTPVAVVLALGLLLVTGCTTLETVGSGAALGAGTGAIVGHQSGETAAGAGIGAAVGALGGYIFDLEKRQVQTKEELNRANNVSVRIPGPAGSFRYVPLVRHPEGWMAPRGEIFPGAPPTPAQLKQLGY